LSCRESFDIHFISVLRFVIDGTTSQSAKLHKPQQAAGYPAQAGIQLIKPK